MDDKVIECPKCGTSLSYEDEHIGQVLSCPSCGVEFQLTLPDDEEQAAAPPPAAGEPAAGEPAAADAPKLPERMKANRLVDGRTCPKCGQGIFFGQDVHNCQTCGQTVHDECWEEGGCPTCSQTPRQLDSGGPPVGLREAPLAPKRLPGLPPPVPTGSGDGNQEGMKECRFCGELIQAKAKKCRHCGEYQADKDRKPGRSASPGGAEDDKLSAGEWVFGILCGGIACIVGIVWLIQGKKKGWKLILVAILSQIILRAIIAAVTAAR